MYAAVALFVFRVSISICENVKFLAISLSVIEMRWTEIYDIHHLGSETNWLISCALLLRLSMCAGILNRWMLFSTVPIMLLSSCQIDFILLVSFTFASSLHVARLPPASPLPSLSKRER